MKISTKRQTFVSSLCAAVALSTGPLSGVAWASHPVSQHHPVSSFRPASTSGQRLCQLGSKVNRLTVTRRHSANRIIFSFPATVTSRNAVRIRTLAWALCALPPSSVRLQCTVDLNVLYSLNFGYLLHNDLGGRSIALVTVDPRGCEYVTGLSSPRWTRARPQFWSVLGAAIGLPDATPTTFAGKVAKG